MIGEIIKIYLNGEREERFSRVGEFTFGEIVSFKAETNVSIYGIKRIFYVVKPVHEVVKPKKVIDARFVQFTEPPTVFKRIVLKDY